MKLRDGILLVVLVLLFVILAYLVSSKNPKQGFLAPVLVPMRGFFRYGPAFGGNRGHTTVVVNGGSSSSSSSSSSGSGSGSSSSGPTMTGPITTPGPTPPPASPFTLMGYN